MCPISLILSSRTERGVNNAIKAPEYFYTYSVRRMVLMDKKKSFTPARVIKGWLAFNENLLANDPVVKGWIIESGSFSTDTSIFRMEEDLKTSSR